MAGRTCVCEDSWAAAEEDWLVDLDVGGHQLHQEVCDVTVLQLLEGSTLHV